jgi:uncharacterized membrane protein YcaP (DUF421 family)
VLNSGVSFTEGLAALALLTGLQWIVAAVTSRWPWSRRAVTACPRVVLRDGRFDAAALTACHLTEADVLQTVRSSGNGDLVDIAAVVLETNGAMSVIRRQSFGDGSALGSLV